MFSRRDLLLGSLLAVPILSIHRASAAETGKSLRQALADLEHREGGRLGVAVLDTAHAIPLAYRGTERFPLCSTHKLLSVAFVLARVDQGKESLARRIVYGPERLTSYAPITAKHVDGAGLTVGELCAAAITLSDNGAANLLLDSFGGPRALTSYLRSLGDTVTRLDRDEPTLNEVGSDDPRDTTTPLAMLGLMRKFLGGRVLSPPSRDQLTAWLAGCKTGDKRIKAGVPQGWRVGDKTGSGSNNATNDVAILWPSGGQNVRPPILIAAYYVGSTAPIERREAVLAEVGRLAAMA